MNYDNIIGKVLIINYNTIAANDVVIAWAVRLYFKTTNDDRIKLFNGMDTIKQVGEKILRRKNRDVFKSLFRLKDYEIERIYSLLNDESIGLSEYMKNYESFKYNRFISQLNGNYDIIKPDKINFSFVFDLIMEKINDYKIFLIDSVEMLLRIAEVAEDLQGKIFIVPMHSYNIEYYKDKEIQVKLLNLMEVKEFAAYFEY